MVYDYGWGETRLERARRRAEKQKRMALIAAAVIGVVALLLIVAAWRRGAATRNVSRPAESLKNAALFPSVVVTWPSPEKYGSRTFEYFSAANDNVAELATLVVRRGQPFTVSVKDAPNWTVNAVSAETKNEGATIRWSPTSDGSTLKLFCRPVANGWRKIAPWTLPKYELRIRGLVPAQIGGSRQQIELKGVKPPAAPTSCWVSANVLAQGDGAFSWDERAIPLLETANKQIAYRGPQPGPRIAMPTPPPKSPRWYLANNFDRQKKRTAGDAGSYFRLNDAEGLASDSPETMTRLARLIAEGAESASIKFILNEQGSMSASATLRLEFDESETRGGWVRSAGQSEATTLRWWDESLGESLDGEGLSPSLPR